MPQDGGDEIGCGDHVDARGQHGDDDHVDARHQAFEFVLVQAGLGVYYDVAGVLRDSIEPDFGVGDAAEFVERQAFDFRQVVRAAVEPG